MSTFYIEDLKDRTKSIFNKRVIYLFDSKEREYKNLIDFNFGEKLLYGRVTRNFVPMYLNSQFLKLKNLNAVADPQTTLSAANFVVDMFSDLSRQFDKSLALGKISADDPFLSNLKAYKAYEDPRQLYNSYLENYLQAITKQFKSQKLKFKDFHEFMTHFENLISVVLPEFPFTFAAYIKSKYCPVNTSGLAIEIADIDYFSDQEKIDKFINSPNWKFYLNACRSYGFMVDKNIPWRIVADIAGPETLKYAKNYGFADTNIIIKLGYGRTDMVFFNNFKFYLLRLYNLARSKSYAITEECNGRTIAKIVKSKNYNIEEIEEILTQERLLKLYFKIRFLEDENNFDSSSQNRIVNDCLGISKFKSLSAGLTRFESIVNKPFDYRGSLSYINTHLKARME